MFDQQTRREWLLDSLFYWLHRLPAGLLLVAITYFLIEAPLPFHVPDYVQYIVRWIVALVTAFAVLNYVVREMITYLSTSAAVRRSSGSNSNFFKYSQYSPSSTNADVHGVETNGDVHRVETNAADVPGVVWREDLTNAELLQKMAQSSTRPAPAQVADEQFIESRLRLQAAIESLEKRANFNLVSGLVITFSGLALLFYYVTHPVAADNPSVYFVETYLPRLTLVILIEFFAFFFLRLYKASLSEVKYFENEITNIEMKRVTLQTVLVAKNNDKLLITLVDMLGKTERNHVLEKGQTTVDIETARLGHATVTKLASDVVAAVAGAAKKAKGKGLLDD